MTTKPRNIELLAPARNAQVGRDAIDHGADAVYIGATAFGARAQAGNSVPDIAALADYAHRYDARVYVTVNTLVYESELAAAERMIHDLYRAEVDSLIVQDLGLLRLDLPPIALHASTQCDICTPAKARFLQELGFSQLVLARELTLSEISDISREVAVPLEVFCHGALCVSYSGRCQISQALRGRSANRGECAQFCRLPYDLEDAAGNKLLTGRHLLSLRDLNATQMLRPMIDAGVSSFKIEGRLKESAYVRNIVAHYRRQLDQIIAGDDSLRRSSCGTSNYTFSPSPAKSFNRGFTQYFISGRTPANGHSMASPLTPKSQGEPLGRVATVRGNRVTLKETFRAANGDGISYAGTDGSFTGMRVNRVEGRTLILNGNPQLRPGTMIYRTHDKAFNDLLTKPSATRKLSLDLRLRVIGNVLALDAEDERGSKVTHTLELEQAPQPARADQSLKQRETLAKLGDTVYDLRSCATAGDVFIPLSTLATLRRETLDLLSRAHRMARTADRRRRENLSAPAPYPTLVSADNIANTLARQLMTEHGATVREPAIECATGALAKGHVLMHTRYCLRRELGACLRDKNSSARLPRELFLRHGDTRLQLTCDCRNCEMLITLAQ